MSTIAERGRAHIFLGDRFFAHDNMATSTDVEAIRGAIRAPREDRAVAEELRDWLERVGWKCATATNDWGRWRVTAVSGRDDGHEVRATVVGGFVSLPPSENSAAIRESTLDLLELNGIPVSR